MKQRQKIIPLLASASLSAVVRGTIDLPSSSSVIFEQSNNDDGSSSVGIVSQRRHRLREHRTVLSQIEGNVYDGVETVADGGGMGESSLPELPQIGELVNKDIHTHNDGDRQRQHLPRLLKGQTSSSEQSVWTLTDQDTDISDHTEARILAQQKKRRNGNPPGTNKMKKNKNRIADNVVVDSISASGGDTARKKHSSNNSNNNTMQTLAKRVSRGTGAKKRGTTRQREQQLQNKIAREKARQAERARQEALANAPRNKRGGLVGSRAKKKQTTNENNNRYGGVDTEKDKKALDIVQDEKVGGDPGNKADNKNDKENDNKPKPDTSHVQESTGWDHSGSWRASPTWGYRYSKSGKKEGYWQHNNPWMKPPSWSGKDGWGWTKPEELAKPEELLCPCDETNNQLPSSPSGSVSYGSYMRGYSDPLNPILSGGKANMSEKYKQLKKTRDSEDGGGNQRDLQQAGPWAGVHPPSWQAPPPKWHEPQDSMKPEWNGVKAIKFDDWAPSYGDYGWSPGWSNLPGYAGKPHPDDDWVGGTAYDDEKLWFPGWMDNDDWESNTSWNHHPSWGDNKAGWAPKWNPSTWAPTKRPTSSPTIALCPCPEIIETRIPTYFPTPGPRDLESCEWFFWGGDEGRGSPVGDNTKTPEFQDNKVVDVSAGSRHTFIIDEDGTALVAGFIESFYSYVGHFGVDRELLNEGENEFQPVDKVVNSGGNFVDAPQFMKVYAGAGAPGDSRNMHSLLIDTSGNVYTAGNNHKGQLCFDDLQNRDVFERVSGLPNPAVAAAVGLDFTLILLSDGKVYGCGSNENGELGLGPDVSYAGTPSGNGLSDIVEVSAGLNFGLYLQKFFNEVEGKVFGSGSNLFSQLCESTEGDPVFVPKELAVSKVSSIMAGRESSYYLYPNGRVESCGRNDEGQLADGTFVDSNEPVKVKLPKDIQIHTLGSGPSSRSVFFIADDDIVYAAGQNYRFQLGTGEVGSEEFPVLVEFDDGPQMHEIIKISSSGTHSVAISCELFTEMPTVMPTMEPSFIPTVLPTLNPSEEPTAEPTVEPTQEPTLTPSEDPTSEPTVEPSTLPTNSPTFSPSLFPTTSPTEIETPSPTLTPSEDPTVEPTVEPTTEPSNEPTFTPTFEPTLSPTLIAVNWYYWGAEEGRGLPLGENQQVPLEIEGEIIDVSAGSRHTFLVWNDGTVEAAGFIESDFGYRGHLGLGPVKDCEDDPSKLCENINDPLPVEKVVDADGNLVDAPQFIRAYAGVGDSADSGEMHSLLISKDGKAYVTGNNNKGQLCLGSLDEDYVDYFHEVKGIDNAERGAVGQEFTLILTEDGEVYGCGTNEVGQLGLGDDVDYKAKATKIDGLSGITDLATGLGFAIFLNENDDEVWGTGTNLFGQQCAFTEGNPVTEPNEVSKVIFDGISNKVIQVEANRESSYFLYDNGVVRSCGRNDEGQLGNGDFVNTSDQLSKPIVKVDLKAKVNRLGSGPSAQSVFFISDNSVWASGINDRFQLGIDKIGSRDKPVKVAFEGAVEIEFVSSSGTHTVANGRYI